jgi:hypothetical protein
MVAQVLRQVIVWRTYAETGFGMTGSTRAIRNWRKRPLMRFEVANAVIGRGINARSGPIEHPDPPVVVAETHFVIPIDRCQFVILRTAFNLFAIGIQVHQSVRPVDVMH